MPSGDLSQNQTLLGLGLLSIGRTWGYRRVSPPSEERAAGLLSTAIELGIRFFDTAPAYGSSERILGKFLAGIERPRDLRIATKLGEFWDGQAQTTHISHSFDDLARSLRASLKHLSRIDLLQVHKATTQNVVSRDVFRVLDLALEKGVGEFGASISDVETAKLACKSGRYHYLQFPYNRISDGLAPVFEIAAEYGLRAIVNRPFAMGEIVPRTDKQQSLQDAYSQVLRMNFSGFVLTGTSSVEHLKENVAAFREASD